MAHAKDFKVDPVFIEIGGKKRQIKFDLNSYAELEKRYGTVQAAMDNLQKGNISTLKILLWAGLIHDEAVIDELTGEPSKYNITPFEVGSWISPGMLPEVSDLLGKAIGATLPEGVTVDNVQEKIAELQTETQKNG